jgi:hypothetical protein
VHHLPGVAVAPEAPRQGAPLAPGEFAFRDHSLKVLQSYEIRARVASREDYRFDRGAALAPTDLAVVWGPMSDSAVLAKYSITQSGRWYRWWSDTEPVPREVVIANSANMHMIPADETVAARLAAVRPGQVIHARGSLVEARGKDGFTWRSSLSRTDTGDGSCELMFVEVLEVR